MVPCVLRDVRKSTSTNDPKTLGAMLSDLRWEAGDGKTEVSVDGVKSTGRSELRTRDVK